MIARKWRPIQPVDADSGRYDFSEINSLQQQWLSIRQRTEQGNPDAYKAFLEKLGRSWAIETGIIEGLYTLDRGVTETLIERGLEPEYIERGGTNREPRDLVKILKDQEESISLLYRYIQGSNPLTVSFIRQLHQVITRSQDTYRAVDQFGTWFDARLEKGAFKKLPNNPTRQDGSVHEYCPPEQVDSEIDNLLYFYNEMQKERKSFHPLLTGAWLHHAFTQIHPFQDGNGRVVRALLTWHLVKENFLPVVISRDDREKHIESLESADSGDLNPFIDLIVQLEKRTVLEALGESEPAAQPGVVDQVIDHIVEQIRRRNQERDDNLRSVEKIAVSLRDYIRGIFENEGDKIRQRLHEVDMVVRPYIDEGGPDFDNGHYYSAEVAALSQKHKHPVNWSEPRFFTRLSLRVTNSPQPRLVFVICLYPAGRSLTGIMTAIAFARIEPGNINRDSEAVGQTPYYRDCVVNPGTFTWQDDEKVVKARFTQWIEACLSLALNYWLESMA